MNDLDVFHLAIMEERFNQIMKQEPKKRVGPAERLMEDMEGVFMIPAYSVDTAFESKYPDVMALYEKVNIEANTEI